MSILLAHLSLLYILKSLKLNESLKQWVIRNVGHLLTLKWLHTLSKTNTSKLLRDILNWAASNGRAWWWQMAMTRNWIQHQSLWFFSCVCTHRIILNGCVRECVRTARCVHARMYFDWEPLATAQWMYVCECVWVAQNNHFITRYKICIFVFADKQTTAEWIRNYERNMKEWKVILFSVREHLKWDSGMWLLLSTYTNIDENCVHHQH